jgi:hypothetical protein
VPKIIKALDHLKMRKNSFKIAVGVLETRPYFCAKFSVMQVRKKSKGLYWLLFFISTAALCVAIAAHWPWLTLILPFVTTFFVLAMDII